MPHNQSQWVTHIVDGGWATDLGTTLYATPQDGELRIPWCTTCENIKFRQDGGWGKYPGMSRFEIPPIIAPPSSTGLIESSRVSHVYDYVRMGSDLIGTHKRMAVVGSWLYDISSLLGAVRIGDLALVSTDVINLSTFNDLLIIGGGQPKSWDQTTFQVLAGTPPGFRFSIPHAGRHWGAGIPANPSRIYYTPSGNPEDWVGAGSGSIDIDPGDGDGIVGILSWKKELWVFKGPHRLSIHRITGTSSSDFSRTTFIRGISASGQDSIFQVGDDFAFWSPRGSCHSLTATANYGDYSQAYLNFPILSWCRNPDNLTNGQFSNSNQIITDFSQNISYALLNNSKFNIETPQVLMMDWKFKTENNPYPRFSRLQLGKFSALGLTRSVFNPSQQLPTFGTPTGNLYQEWPGDEDAFIQGDVSFPYTLETPALTYGPSYYEKTIVSVGVDIMTDTTPRGGDFGTLQMSVAGKRSPAQIFTLSNQGFVGLGTFILGKDQLGYIGNTPNYYEDINCTSTAMTYSFRETTTGDVGQDVKVKHFSALISSSGASLENY